MGGKVDDVISRARKKVQRAIEQAERDNRNRLLKRRIELANAGVRAYEAGRIGEAVQNFLGYLKILEEWKGVGQGGLTPTLFDPKKDVYELLLISAVYWDLTKLFDRTKSEERRKEFLHYMEKYILFSKGMPFEPLCAETLRKYVNLEKPVHRAEFRNAYKVLSGSNCFVATALLDVTDPRTLPSLRTYRDQVLARHAGGRLLIRVYYRFGPLAAQVTDCLPERLRCGLGKALDDFSVRAARVSATTSRSGPDGTRTGCR
ncbi:MAG: hypothetical protein A2X94_09945 [Bdellovibrionales bacterium GWB1_55_8]|nr:MAG: hypothetical protein A2X94_09945 [Bdellovibrionales bacterium GWB1_55_8]